MGEDVDPDVVNFIQENARFTLIWIYNNRRYAMDDDTNLWRVRSRCRYIQVRCVTSFLDYSMSVIVQRALPDVRDGMKPVHASDPACDEHAGHHRRMSPIRSVRVSSVRSSVSTTRTVIRPFMMPWSVWHRIFSYRYPLVDGHGNFGIRWTAMERRPCDIPKLVCLRFPWK